MSRCPEWVCDQEGSGPSATKGDEMENRYNSLLNYLELKKKGGFGWKTNYIEDLNVDKNGYPWLAGFMESMLDDLISIIGNDRCIGIVSQFNELDQ